MESDHPEGIHGVNTVDKNLFVDASVEVDVERTTSSTKELQTEHENCTARMVDKSLHSRKKQRQQRYLQKQSKKTNSMMTKRCYDNLIEENDSTIETRPPLKKSIPADELYLNWFHEHRDKRWITWVTSNDVDDFFANGGCHDESSQTVRLSMLQQYYNIQHMGQRTSRSYNATDCQRQNSKCQDILTTNDTNYFIAEGTETIRLFIERLRYASKSEAEMFIDSNFVPYQPIKLQSIFIKPSLLFDQPVNILKDIEQTCIATANGKEKQSSRVKSSCCFTSCPPFHVFVGTEDIISSIAGYSISRGALACGIKPDSTIFNENWIFAYIKQKQAISNQGTIRIVAIDGINDTSNLGSIIRCSSAFSVDMILLSSNCCSEWSRRSVRVSMGHISRVPCIRMSSQQSFEYMLKKLSQEPYHVKSYAAVIDNADILLEEYPKESLCNWCCVVGNEFSGISYAIVQACTYKIRIGMEPGVDSLSVPIATGILLHGLKEREKSSRKI